jgi:hypothetical protein
MPVIVIPTKPHSETGASGAKRWIKCPGSCSAIRKAPPQKPNKYGAEGTVAHAILEERLERILGRRDNPQEPSLFSRVHSFLDIECEHDGFTFTVDKEMLAAVQVAIDFVLGIQKKFNLPNEAIKTEQELQVVGHDGLWGWSDISIFAESIGLLMMLDYKHGAGVKVDVEDNEQLMMYGIATLDSLTDEQKKNVKDVEIVVIQPRIFGTENNGITRTKISVEFLEQFRATLIEAVIRTEEPGAPLAAGEWCRWCPAKAYAKDGRVVECPAFAANSEAVVDFKHLAEVKAPFFPVPKEITPELIGKILTQRKAFDSWLDSVEVLAEELMLDGVDVPGYKVVKNFGNRKYINEKAAEDALSMMLGDKAYTKTLLSPSQAEKAGVSKQFIAQLVENPYKGYAVVSAKDKREAVTLNAQLDFAQAAEQVIELAAQNPE